MSLDNEIPRSPTSSVQTLPREVEVTLLFCDVVRSTELTRRLGDRGAYRVVCCFHDAVLRAAARHRGEELELRGDGVLLAFPDPTEAVDCSVAIQRALLEEPRSRRVDVRIGIHTGAALEVAGGYFGSNVILTSRIAEVAAPGETLASETLAHRVPGATADAGRWVLLKGIPEPCLVFSVPWQIERSPVVEPPYRSLAVEALLSTMMSRPESKTKGETSSCMLERRRSR